MGSRPANAWIVLAAWLGLMVGVGAALRPTPPRVLPPADATALAAAWGRVLAAAAPERPALFVGTAACPCDAAARRTIIEWARSEGLELRDAPALAGIALADAEGRLRFAGDAAALTVHCGGLRGFQAWWTAPAERPVLTAPCTCA